MGNKVRNINRGDSVNSIWEVANTGNQKVWLWEYDICVVPVERNKKKRRRRKKREDEEKGSDTNGNVPTVLEL